MKLDKEFKNDVNREFKEADYVGSKVFVRVVLVVLIISVLSAVGGVGYKKWQTNKDREIFKQSVAYNEAAATFLADSYKQYNEAETPADKKAITDYVVMRYPNLSYAAIENETLKQFYRNCLNK